MTSICISRDTQAAKGWGSLPVREIIPNSPANTCVIFSFLGKKFD